MYTNLTAPSNPELTSMLSNNLEYVVDHKELHNFAIQIARGMKHLQDLQITHRWAFGFYQLWGFWEMCQIPKTKRKTNFPRLKDGCENPLRMDMHHSGLWQIVTSHCRNITFHWYLPQSLRLFRVNCWEPHEIFSYAVRRNEIRSGMNIESGLKNLRNWRIHFLGFLSCDFDKIFAFQRSRCQKHPHRRKQNIKNIRFRSFEDGNLCKYEEQKGSYAVMVSFYGQRLAWLGCTFDEFYVLMKSRVKNWCSSCIGSVEMALYRSDEGQPLLKQKRRLGFCDRLVGNRYSR